MLDINKLHREQIEKRDKELCAAFVKLKMEHPEKSLHGLTLMMSPEWHLTPASIRLIVDKAGLIPQGFVRKRTTKGKARKCHKTNRGYGCVPKDGSD